MKPVIAISRPHPCAEDFLTGVATLEGIPAEGAAAAPRTPLEDTAVSFALSCSQMALILAFFAAEGTKRKRPQPLIPSRTSLTEVGVRELGVRELGVRKLPDTKGKH